MNSKLQVEVNDMSRASGFHIEKYQSSESMHQQHAHSTYELYFSIGTGNEGEGVRVCHMGSRECEIHPNDIIILPPNMYHRMSGNGGVRIRCDFTKDFITEHFSHETFNNLTMLNDVFLFRPSDSTRNFLRASFEALVKEYEANEDDDNYFSCRLLSLLLLMYSSKDSHISVAYTEEKFRDVLEYIDENYSEIFGIEDITDALNISRGTLFRLFKKHFKVSPMTYLNSIKIQKSCALLAKRNINITEIALKCVFNSCTYFDRVFREFTSITPAQYRKMLSSRSQEKLDFLI
jgi:AraC-like DNA-binding protein